MQAEQVAHGSAIPGPAPVELTVPAARPIGKRLLATMGWREGQGIGPRVRSRKSRRQQLALPAEVLGSLPEQFREVRKLRKIFAKCSIFPGHSRLDRVARRAERRRLHQRIRLMR